MAEADTPKSVLSEAIAAYLQDTRLTKATKTVEAYAETMRGFAESTRSAICRTLIAGTCSPT